MRRLRLRVAISLLVLLALLCLASVSAMRPALADANPASPRQQLQHAWRQAKTIGRYDYRTELLQTAQPTIRLENVGRGPTTSQMVIEGAIDRRSDSMTMEISGDQQQALSFKIENGVALGHTGDGHWREVDAERELFAPSGDPMGFLVAAEDVRLVDLTAESDLFPGQLLPAALTTGMTQYRFEISGPKYARYMRDQMSF